MTTIISGTTNKPISSDSLRRFFQLHNEYDGFLYVGYPIIGTADGAFPIDALWLSPTAGVVAFNLVEGKETTNYEDIQDDYANKIEAKLKSYKQLVQRRQLCVEIHVVTFAPALVRKKIENPDYPLCINHEDLSETLNEFSWADNGYYEKLVSVIQAISTIRKAKKKRSILNSQSRGAKLQALEDSNFHL